MFFNFNKIDICEIKLSNKRGFKFYFLYLFRAIYLTFKRFIQSKGSLVAASLTFYTMLSMVPVFALSMAIAEKLKIVDYFEKELISRFSAQDEVLVKILAFANNMVEAAKTSLITFLGLSLLFISVFKALSNMEGYFNTIWEVGEKRNLAKKSLVFISLLLIIPVFFLLSAEFKFILIQKARYFFEGIPFFHFFSFIFKLIPYIFVWFLFTFIYMFVPNKKVSFLKAFITGIIIGFIYELLQWGYIYFQVGFSRYNAIYSSFAALPLFLLWLQLSWSIFLLGAQFSYVISNIKYCEYEKKCSNFSKRMLKIVSIYILNIFLKEKIILEQEDLYDRYSIPYSLSEKALNILFDAKLIKVDKKGNIINSSSLLKLSIYDAYIALDISGKEKISFINTKDFKQINKSIKDLYKKIKIQKNALLRDL